MTEQELREKYRIPSHYRYDGKIQGVQVFSFYDAEITVHADGSCTQTMMIYSSAQDKHAFVTHRWPLES